MTVEHIKSLRGKYKSRLTSSEVFAESKIREIELEGFGLWTKGPCCPWHEPQTKGVFYQIFGNLERFMRSCIPIWALFYAFLSPVELLAGQERLLLPFQVNFHGVWAAWSLSQTH